MSCKKPFRLCFDTQGAIFCPAPDGIPEYREDR